MDFHSLTRKELQTLSKKNKIPANITNIAMADALKALETVEGIEEFLKPSKSETAQSSIESPEKMEVTSPYVGGGRTAPPKTVNDEPGTFQTLTMTRRSTRKLVAKGQSSAVETPLLPNSRRVPAASASARRLIETQFKEIEEEDTKTGKKQNRDIPETPAMMTDGRQRGLKGESTSRRVYGTRRSARLAEKNVEDLSSKAKERFETVKSDLFSKDSDQILQMNVIECSDNPGEVSENAGIDLKEESEERMEKIDGIEVVSVIKSDHSIENQIELECENDGETGENIEVVKSNIIVEQDGNDADDNGLNAGNYSDIHEETNHSGDVFDKPPEIPHLVPEQSGFGDLYTTKRAEYITGKGDETCTNQKMVFNDIAVKDVEREIDHENYAFSSDNQTQKLREDELDSDKDRDSRSSDNTYFTEEVLENSESENDMGFGNDLANNPVANKDWDTEEEAALDAQDGEQENNDPVNYAPEELLPKAEEQQEEKVTGTELMTVEINNSLPDEFIANTLKEEPIGHELNGSALSDGISDASSESEMNPVKDADLEVKQPVAKGESTRNITGDYAYVFPNVSTRMDTPMQCDEPNQSEEFEYVPEEDAHIFDVLDTEKPLPTPVPPAAVIGDIPDSSCLTSDMHLSLSETEVGNIVEPTSPTPVKKSSTMTPVKKSGAKTPNTTKKGGHVPDNKENIDNSGRKLILTKEKKEYQGIGQSIDYNNCSLRWLTKEFKKKIVITNNSNQIEKGNTVAASRPALQTLPDNRPAAQGEQ